MTPTEHQSNRQIKKIEQAIKHFSPVELAIILALIKAEHEIFMAIYDQNEEQTIKNAINRIRAKWKRP